MNRVVIESVGVCCAGGLGDERVLDPRAPAPLSAPSLPRFAARRVGRAVEFDPEELVGQKKSLKLMSRAALLGVAAARELALPDGDVARAGLFLGVGMSGGEIAQLAGLLDASLGSDGDTVDLAAMGREGLGRLNPLLSFHVLNNMPLCHVSIELGLGGPHGAIYAPGAEALQAFERAADAVREGDAPWAVAGGADAPLNTVTLALRGAREHLAEAAALAVLRAVERPEAGAIEWLGLGEGEADLWISVGESARSLVPRGARTIALDALVGDTLAASGALAVALGVRQLRVDRSIGRVAVCARDDVGPQVARMARAA